MAKPSSYLESKFLTLRQFLDKAVAYGNGECAIVVHSTIANEHCIYKMPTARLYDLIKKAEEYEELERIEK